MKKILFWVALAALGLQTQAHAGVQSKPKRSVTKGKIKPIMKHDDWANVYRMARLAGEHP